MLQLNPRGLVKILCLEKDAAQAWKQEFPDGTSGRCKKRTVVVKSLGREKDALGGGLVGGNQLSLFTGIVW
jgi:hypothetical protein